METTVRRRRSRHPIAHYWGMVKDMEDSQKLELVTMLIDSVKPAVTSNDEKEDAKLNAALAKFHKDWGGDGSAMEIADELRGSRMDSRIVETW